MPGSITPRFIMGGYYIAHFGLKKVLFSLVCIFNVPFVIYFLFAAYLPQNLWIVGSGLVAEYTSDHCILPDALPRESEFWSY